MNHRFASMVVAAGIALALGSQGLMQPTVGQEKTAATEKAAPAKTAKKPTGRLPAYYAKVGVSDEQRKKIYSVQATYDTQIAALQKQIDELKAKEDAEVVAVLTPEQKAKLDELLAEAKKAAEARATKKKSS
jgi:hypothetical protein